MKKYNDAVTGPSFSLRNRLGRVLWNFVYAVLFRLSPTPFHKWRSFLLKCFGAQVGKNIHVYPKVVIWAPWNVKLDDECGIASGATLYSQGHISVGKRAVISQGVYICAGSHDYTDPGFPIVTKPIIIGDYAWIAAQAFVHPGVVINEGCVIGARAVVTKDMPSWKVCAGQPCIAIKPRVSDFDISKFKLDLK